MIRKMIYCYQTGKIINQYEINWLLIPLLKHPSKDYLRVEVKTTFMLEPRNWKNTIKLSKLVTKLWHMDLLSFCFSSLDFIGSSWFSMKKSGQPSMWVNFIHTLSIQLYLLLLGIFPGSSNFCIWYFGTRDFEYLDKMKLIYNI